MKPIAVIIALLTHATAASATFDGCFLDETCVTGIRWTQSLGDSIDFRRAGYESYDAWESAYRAGWATFYVALRNKLNAKEVMPNAETRPGQHELPMPSLPIGAAHAVTGAAHPTNTRSIIVGNCGPVGDPAANGWMVENFPHQRGGTIAEYLARDTTYTQPTLNWLSVWNGTPETMRYALGVACLGNGVAAFPWSPEDAARGFWPANEVPEMWPRGWLGTPLGPAIRGRDGLWRRLFTGGSVTVDEARREATFTRGR